MRMDDYIARKTAVDTCIAVQKEVEAIMFEDGPFHTDNAKNVAKLLKKFATQMSAPPAADVAPVVHGRWIPTPEYDSCWCSCCKKQYTGFFASYWNYCPSCAARMDGGADA